jgi:glycosyltransferase involved in cell wall biosynthesis
LAALMRVRQRYPEARLVIAGGGPLEGKVRDEVKSLGLSGAVELLGNVPSLRMPEVIRGADAIVLPSYMSGETFPISLLEGMALGLPAIGSRWFGIPDIVVDGETGLLVEPHDVTGLAAAMEKLVAEPAQARRMGEAGRVRARTRFSSTAVAQAYADLYAGRS